VELVAPSRRAWELVNHTPVAIEPLERTMFGPPSFRGSFEQRDMEGRWRTVYDGSGSDGASPDSTPLAPGDSRGSAEGRRRTVGDSPSAASAPTIASAVSSRRRDGFGGIVIAGNTAPGASGAKPGSSYAKVE
jgi:hypothetical protein